MKSQRFCCSLARQPGTQRSDFYERRDVSYALTDRMLNSNHEFSTSSQREQFTPVIAHGTESQGNPHLARTSERHCMGGG
jgi:hypothetical protein